MLSCLTKEFTPDDRNNESCGHGLQEHLMQSDVLVKYLLDLSCLDLYCPLYSLITRMMSVMVSKVGRKMLRTKIVKIVVNSIFNIQWLILTSYQKSATLDTINNHNVCLECVCQALETGEGLIYFCKCKMKNKETFVKNSRYFSVRLDLEIFVKGWYTIMTI